MIWSLGFQWNAADLDKEGVSFSKLSQKGGSSFSPKSEAFHKTRELF